MQTFVYSSSVGSTELKSYSLLLVTGHLFVEVIPCDETGKALAEDDFNDDPKDLVGRHGQLCLYSD